MKKILILTLLALSSTPFACASEPEAPATECIVAVSDLQLQEIAANSEATNEDALNIAKSELEKTGYSVQTYSALDNGARAELTGRALFLEYRGAKAEIEECRNHAKFEVIKSHMDLALVSDLTLGKTHAKSMGAEVMDRLSCRRLASDGSANLDRANRTKAFTAALRGLPACQALQEKHPVSWLF